MTKVLYNKGTVGLSLVLSNGHVWHVALGMVISVAIEVIGNQSIQSFWYEDMLVLCVCLSRGGACMYFAQSVFASVTQNMHVIPRFANARPI